jgi:hypothetical protein
MLWRYGAICSWVFEDTEVSGRVLVFTKSLAMESVHRFLVWLDAPGYCVSFFDFNPAHNVRLCRSAFCLGRDLDSAYFAVDFQLF